MTLRRLLPLVLLVALGIFFALNLGRPQQAVVRSAMVGKPVPTFALQGVAPDGPGLSSADLAGSGPVLVNFFASWCLPCRVEAPQLKALKEAGITLHGIALRDAPDDVMGFLARHGNPFTKIGMDRDGKLAIAFGSSGVPETYLVDGQGIIRAQHIGEIKAEDVPALLKEAARWR